VQVWKFVIGVGTGEQRVQMPKGAKLLSIQLQDGVPAIWALCDPSSPSVARRIKAYGTGDDVAPSLPFVATLQIGLAVLHYFDHGDA
jgi:hypothetical protein